MVDKYLYGDASRRSPEAPVLIHKVEREEFRLGGSGNVASNLVALGAKTYLMALVGRDGAAGIVEKLLKDQGIVSFLHATDMPTIQKVRIIAERQHLLRIDYENKPASLDLKPVFLELRKIIPEVDIIVVSDYAKGFITKELMDEVRQLAESLKRQIIVDPKPQNISAYKGVTLVTPNHKEAVEMVPYARDCCEAGEALRQELGASVVITRGERGMSLFNSRIMHIPTRAREVADVTGAGDTVVSMLALSLASGATLEEAVVIANHAAGIVVGKLGTATVSSFELRESLMPDII